MENTHPPEILSSDNTKIYDDKLYVDNDNNHIYIIDYADTIKSKKEEMIKVDNAINNFSIESNYKTNEINLLMLKKNLNGESKELEKDESIKDKREISFGENLSIKSKLESNHGNDKVPIKEDIDTDIKSKKSESASNIKPDENQVQNEVHIEEIPLNVDYEANKLQEEVIKIRQDIGNNTDYDQTSKINEEKVTVVIANNDIIDNSKFDESIFKAISEPQLMNVENQIEENMIKKDNQDEMSSKIKNTIEEMPLINDYILKSNTPDKSDEPMKENPSKEEPINIEKVEEQNIICEKILENKNYNSQQNSQFISNNRYQNINVEDLNLKKATEGVYHSTHRRKTYTTGPLKIACPVDFPDDISLSNKSFKNIIYTNKDFSIEIFTLLSNKINVLYRALIIDLKQKSASSKITTCLSKIDLSIYKSIFIKHLIDIKFENSLEFKERHYLKKKCFVKFIEMMKENLKLKKINAYNLLRSEQYKRYLKYKLKAKIFTEIKNFSYYRKKWIDEIQKEIKKNTILYIFVNLETA
jgi:hypothetical protein